MNKSIYRNIFYVKESISEFFKINKKYLFISIISIVLGFSIGFCVGVSNFSNFTFINFTDKIILKFLCGESGFLFFLKQSLEYFFIAIILLLINNFPFLSFINYIFFSFLTFRLIINCIIFCSMSKFTGIIYAIFYFIIKLSIIFMFVIIFMICKSASECSGTSSKLSYYPYKAILIVFAIILILCLLLLLVTLIFSKFLSIII